MPPASRAEFIYESLAQDASPFIIEKGNHPEHFHCQWPVGAQRAQLCDSGFHPQPPIWSLCRSRDATSSPASCSLSPPALLSAAACLRVSASAGLLSRRRATGDPPEGIDTIAGGNAPGKRPLSGPTLPGSNPADTPPLMAPAAQGHGTPVGSGDRAARFPGALPPATSLCPGGARGGRAGRSGEVCAFQRYSAALNATSVHICINAKDRKRRRRRQTAPTCAVVGALPPCVGPGADTSRGEMRYGTTSNATLLELIGSSSIVTTGRLRSLSGSKKRPPTGWKTTKIVYLPGPGTRSLMCLTSRSP